jgi:hypothetical protein
MKSNNTLTNKEEKRWNKMLKNRKLNTLMIPLEKKGKNDDTEQINPW